MKKLLCVLLILVVLFSFAACGKGNDTKVTIYIPNTLEVYTTDGTKLATITYVYEEGWQDKESFTVTLTSDNTDALDSGKIVYSAKKIVQTMSNGVVMEGEYNAEGKLIRLINRYVTGGRQEVTYTYNDKGLMASQKATSYETADASPVTNTTEFTYTETETGFTSTQEMYGQNVVSTYDKKGRQTSQIVTMNDKELSRLEIIYDANGNTASQITYANGKKQSETKYTWTAVEVSAAQAARLPQFKQGN